MAEQKKVGGVAVSEVQGKGVSVSLIVVIILLIAGGVYLLRGKNAVAPVEVVIETPTTTPVLVENALVTERVGKVLATGLGISPDLVKVVSITEEEWSNGCLGLGKEGEMCTQALTPGYEAKLTAQGVTYTYRTDKAVNMIKIDRTALGK